MKYVFVCFSFLLCLLSCRRELTENILTGTIEGLRPGDHLLLVRVDAKTSEKVLLDQTTVTEPDKFTLRTDATGTGAILYYIENGGDTSLESLQPGMGGLLVFFEGYAKLTLSGEVEDIHLTKIKGGLYDVPDVGEMMHLNLLGALEQKHAFLLMEDAGESGSEVLEEEAGKLLRSANEKFGTLMRLQREFPRKHPELAYSALLMQYDFELQKDVDEFERRFQELVPAVQASLAGQELVLLLDKVRNNRPGGVAHGFELVSLEGWSVRLADMRGKYVILDFWGSWCVPCREVAPKLVEFYNEIKGREDIVMVGVGCWEQEAANWRQAIEEDGLLWLQVLDADRTVSNAYVISSVPHTVLISPEGIILKRDHPLRVLPEIKQLLGI